MKKKNRRLLLIFLPFLGVLLLAAAAIVEKTDRPLAFVQKFRPSVGILDTGEIENIKERGAPLYNGDTLRTNENGFALVQFMDKSIAKVKPESQLVVEGNVQGRDNTNTRIGLKSGEVFFNITEQGRDNFEVATNTTVASVKGTDFGARSTDYFWVDEGEVELLVSESGESATLNNGMYGQVQPDGTIETGVLTDEELDELRREYSEMNEKMDPQIYKLKFIDSNGEEQVIRVKVFENEN